MAEWHIAAELLERFLRTEASREEVRQVVGHLVSGCPRCLEASYRVTSEIGLFEPRKAAHGKAAWEQAYEEVFVRALAFASEAEQRIALEKLRGWAQWAEIEALSPQLRLARVETETRFHTFGFYERLLEASCWYRSTDPAEAVDIVRLAIGVAERLDPAQIGERRVADLQAAAWGALGNARRIAEDFEGARGAFNEAWRLLEEGAGDPIEQAHLISLEASYMKDIGEFELAESSLEEALELCQKAGDVHQQGRILLQMGEIIGHVHPERGVSHIQKALALIDPSREQRLQLSAQHALSQFLSDSGKPQEALAVLEAARPLFKQFQDERVQLRLHWLEGKIACRLGAYSEAEEIFEQLWDEFRARDLKQEMVLVVVDLAQVLTAKGEPGRAAELAAQCTSIMQSWGLHRFALAAWLVFQSALERGTVLGDLFQRVEEYYRRHWFRPAELDLNRS